MSGVVAFRQAAWGAGSLVSFASSALNSLADGGRVLSSAINNSAGVPYISLRVFVAAEGTSDPSNATLEFYILPSLDGGTTFTYGDASNQPPRSALAAVIALQRTTGEEAPNVFTLPAPAGYFKILLKNRSGDALASSGNLAYYVLHAQEFAPL